MSVEERFERLMEVEHLVNALSVCVARLRSEAQKQVAAIRESIADGERRKAASTWDGKQPDLWLKNGRLWRKPTDADIGKAVRVGHFGADPADMDAVKLVGFHQEAGQHEGFICEGSKGQRVLWPLAWIEFEPDEDPGESGKTHISVQVERSIQVDEAGWLATVSDDVFQGIASAWFGTQEKPFDPINDPAPIYRKGQCRLMSEDETIEVGDFFWRSVDQLQNLANFTIGMKVKDAVARGRGYNELWVFYRPIEATKSDNSKETPRIVDAYKKLVQSDSDFAWTVFCNLAVMAQDAGARHKESNERAADLMRNWFGVDVRKLWQWRFFETHATDEPKRFDSYYREATSFDIAKAMDGKEVKARFRDFDTQNWIEGRCLYGWKRRNDTGKFKWTDSEGVAWMQCQVYDPQKD
jgi:hypothetical protein